MKTINPSLLSEMVNLKHQFLSDSIIADRLDISFPTVNRYLSKYMSDYNLYKKQKYKFNINYFEIIDTEEKAYWLGFLYGDGNVYKNILSLYIDKIDKLHVEKFRECLQSNHPIHYVKRDNTVKIVIINKKTVKDLGRWGCIPNKSLNLYKLPNIADKLMKHFIRGYFDADGCIYIQKDKKKYGNYEYIGFTIASTKDFLENIQGFLINNNIITKKNKINKISANGYLFRHVGKNALSFLIYIYNNTNIYLDRKKNKLEMFRV